MAYFIRATIIYTYTTTYVWPNIYKAIPINSR